jgi:tRNA(Ile)-lysidine synthetase-like protein
MEGVTEAGNWRFRVKLVKRPSALAVAQSEAYLRPPSVGEKWIVRSRLPGDRLRPFGVRGTKKLKDILIDARVPEDARDNIPLICDESGILWVVEHRIAERAAVRDEDETVLHITARPI